MRVQCHDVNMFCAACGPAACVGTLTANIAAACSIEINPSWTCALATALQSASPVSNTHALWCQCLCLVMQWRPNSHMLHDRTGSAALSASRTAASKSQVIPLHHMQPHALLHSARVQHFSSTPADHIPTLPSMQTSHTECCCVLGSYERESTDIYTLRNTRVGALRSSCVSLNKAACQQPLSAYYLLSPAAHARCPAIRTRPQSHP